MHVAFCNATLLNHSVIEYLYMQLISYKPSLIDGTIFFRWSGIK
jgi:hypothetical protein